LANSGDDTNMQVQEWAGFEGKLWKERIDVRDFIQSNYHQYNWGEDFLTAPTERTKNLWARCEEIFAREREKGGVLDIDTTTVSTITSHGPGYIDKENELVVGLQTDAPLRRAIKPFGGIRMVEAACEAYGYKVDPNVVGIFTKYRKTHNEGVFSAYTPDMRAARKAGVITGLPDAYGRGRIIGEYARVPLYGVDRLIAAKELDLDGLPLEMDDENIRLREEISEQIEALSELKEMAASYGFDLSRPALNAREAVQWLYFAYLAAAKEQDGAAMSIGRIDAFLDIYFERDLASGRITEEEAQELIDQFVIKCRLIKYVRTPEYNELFAGDPTWITLSLGGMGKDQRSLVTKTSFRFINTLKNLGPAPEPNITILWSQGLPLPFKRYCARMSIETSSIQYENDDLMRVCGFGDNYAIACCVSAMSGGNQMQFFGARCNLPKVLLMSINEGRDEIMGAQIGPKLARPEGEYLDYEQVQKNLNVMLEWMAALYVNAMNVIHYMHDKYYYERIQMALLDTRLHRFMAFGVAGLSVIADSLSAIKYAKVRAIRDGRGITKDFSIEGDFPRFGNDDDRVDLIAKEIVCGFIEKLRKHRAYRDAEHTLSILTITSNVVYGKKTGATPDGRRAGEPFAPGANPMHERDMLGALASLNSVSKLPYSACKDGISNTFCIVPESLGTTWEEQVDNAFFLVEGYFMKGAHHLNLNVLRREMLEDAMEHPEKYPNLTIRVSGYAVNFVKLTPSQQREVITRTFHAQRSSHKKM
jgi:formate C-acetyltransferase